MAPSSAWSGMTKLAVSWRCVLEQMMSWNNVMLLKKSCKVQKRGCSEDVNVDVSAQIVEASATGFVPNQRSKSTPTRAGQK